MLAVSKENLYDEQKIGGDLGETVSAKDLGPDVDERGDFIKELASGISIDNAVWKLDKTRQAQITPYIKLNQQIASLPSFERNAITDMISEFINSYNFKERDALKESGIVQSMIHSSRPMSYWESCELSTFDGKFEDYLNNKIRPAVEDMLEDLNKDKK